MVSRPHLGTNRSVLAGTARVELCVQGSADLAHLDDGPYEAGGEKEQDPRLIPVPANSYLGREPSPARSRSNPLLLSLTPSPPRPSFCLCLRTLWPVLWMSLPSCVPARPRRVALCDQH